jgi:hypothetical protein
VIFRNFSDASQIVHKLKLRGKNHWADYCKSGEKPVDIPSNAARTYKEEWKGGVIGLTHEEYWFKTGNIFHLKKLENMLTQLA